jgi:hypothetical protein
MNKDIGALAPEGISLVATDLLGDTLEKDKSNYEDRFNG